MPVSGIPIPLPVTINGSLPAGTNNIGSVTSPPSTLAFGQVVIAATGTAVQLPSNVAVNGVRITAHPLNTAPTKLIGGTVGIVGVTDATSGSGNGELIQPGTALGYSASNTNQLYVNGIAGDIFTWSTP